MIVSLWVSLACLAVAVGSVGSPADGRSSSSTAGEGVTTCSRPTDGGCTDPDKPRTEGYGGPPVPLRSLGIPLGHVEIRNTLPTAKEIANQYLNPSGKPVLLRDAARHLLVDTAVSDWTDEYLIRTYPDVLLDVEFERIESREAHQEKMNLKSFVERYRDKDNPLYSVAPIHDSAMARAFRLPPFFSCGGWLDRLQLAIMWLGEYETKSVLHNDDLDGLMCLLSGRKQWYIVDKRHWKKIESDECGWNVADKTGKGYGAFARINVDDVRSELRECYNSIEWYHADLEPGDCLLTPLGWYHQVNSEGRTLGLLLWIFGLRDYNSTSAEDCEKREPEGAVLSDLVWYGDDEPHFTTDDKEWRWRWLKRWMPDHPSIELYEQWLPHLAKINSDGDGHEDEDSIAPTLK